MEFYCVMVVFIMIIELELYRSRWNLSSNNRFICLDA